MELKRVVVTGLGAVTPLGNNTEDTWNNLVAGVSGAAPITLFDASQFKTQFACEVKNLKVNDYIDRKEARKMDRYAQLAIISAMQAIQDSGMNLEEIDKKPCRRHLRRRHRWYQDFRGRSGLLGTAPGERS